MHGFQQHVEASAMCSDLIVSVKGLSKFFPVYEKPHHRLLQMLTPSAEKHKWYREFRALRDVSFEVKRGETFGIVGRNGSGKSTLLQLICGTLFPTSGTVQVNGRIAALLELGAGFNPDFTGRENIYLNGSVLGLSREEIDARFESITEFAGIGDFINQPVKSYSSGMYIRLAFSVAINVTPDLLIIDEALAVGDEAFQRKCFARIQNLRDNGSTILFVSHSAGIVTELCDRAILLDQGELIAQGSPKSVVSKYHKLIYSPADTVAVLREDLKKQLVEDDVAEDAFVTEADKADSALVASAKSNLPPREEAFYEEGMKSLSKISYNSYGASILDVHIETSEGRKVNVLRSGESYKYVYTVDFTALAFQVRFGMMIKTTSGLELSGAVSAAPRDTIETIPMGARVKVKFDFECRLPPATYFLNAGVLGLVDGQEQFLDRQIDAEMFRVFSDPDRLSTGLVEMVSSPDLKVTLSTVSGDGNA